VAGGTIFRQKILQRRPVEDCVRQKLVQPALFLPVRKQQLFRRSMTHNIIAGHECVGPLDRSRRAKLAAAAAAHTRAERWYRGLIGPFIHTDGALVAAVLASHEQATDAGASHLAERHGTDLFVILGYSTS
jgi:hypothetical protein